MNGFLTTTCLNILLLVLYDAHIGMDWLGNHRDKLDCYNKAMECFNEEGEIIKVKGVT